MRDHVNIVGILWIVLGVFSMIGAAALGFLGGGGMMMGVLNAGHDHDAVAAGALVAGILGILAIFVFLMGLVSLFSGLALRKWRPWARIIVIVLSILNLVSFPIGTAIGIYSLVVLFNADVEMAFNTGS
jgi:hypothetical protein